MRLARQYLIDAEIFEIRFVGDVLEIGHHLPALGEARAMIELQSMPRDTRVSISVQVVELELAAAGFAEVTKLRVQL